MEGGEEGPLSRGKWIDVQGTMQGAVPTHQSTLVEVAEALRSGALAGLRPSSFLSWSLEAFCQFAMTLFVDVFAGTKAINTLSRFL